MTLRRRLLTALLCPLLLAALSAVPAQAADTAAPDRQAVEQIVHDYLLKHPEVVVEALQAAEDKMKAQDAERAKASVADHAGELFDDPTSPVGGNPKGDVTIVEFFDYRCPYCKEVEPSLEALLKEDGRIRIVYKEFPILGSASVYATRVALAARKQGKYAAFHAAMMAAKGNIDEKTVLDVASAAGLDLGKLKSDMESPEIEAIIKRDYDLARALDIRGTPGFVIGGEVIAGAIDIATMKAKIAAARKG